MQSPAVARAHQTQQQMSKNKFHLQTKTIEVRKTRNIEKKAY